MLVFLRCANALIPISNWPRNVWLRFLRRRQAAWQATESLLAATTEMQATYEKMLQLHFSGNTAELAAIQPKLETLIKQVSDQAGANNTAFSQLLASGSTELSSSIDSTISQSFILMCVGLVAAVCFAAYVAHAGITAPPLRFRDLLHLHQRQHRPSPDQLPLQRVHWAISSRAPSAAALLPLRPQSRKRTGQSSELLRLLETKNNRRLTIWGGGFLLSGLSQCP